MEDWQCLKKLSKMENEEDVREFERRIWELTATKDPEVLPFLFDLFNDECDFPEVMYNLVHAIETYEDEVYVKALIKKSSSLLEQAPFWFLGLLCAVLNNVSSRKVFTYNMHLIPYEEMSKVLCFLEKESPSHYGLVEELRAQLTHLSH